MLRIARTPIHAYIHTYVCAYKEKRNPFPNWVNHPGSVKEIFSNTKCDRPISTSTRI